MSAMERDWYRFSEMFPDVNLDRYSKEEAMKIILQRFAYRNVIFDEEMIKSFYKFPAKDIKNAIAVMLEEKIIIKYEEGYILKEDLEKLNNTNIQMPSKVYAMHRNDFLIKSNEHWLKNLYSHENHDTLYYLLIDGQIKGIVVGKFRFTPTIEDIIVDLTADDVKLRKKEIIQAVRNLCGPDAQIKRYNGESSDSLI